MKHLCRCTFKEKMKNLKLTTLVMVLTGALLLNACASGNSIKGSAVDRTGTNGATNGNGKVPKSL